MHVVHTNQMLPWYVDRKEGNKAMEGKLTQGKTEGPKANKDAATL